MPYIEQTNNVEVEAFPKFLPDQSHPKQSYFFFTYRIRITNKSKKTLKLLSRHWVITDGHGRSNEVKGEGVVGQTPTLAPSQSYEYSSFCPLPTQTGNMRGSYFFKSDNGEQIEAKIPLFFLRDLSQLH